MPELSLLGFAELLAAISVETDAAERQALNEATKVVQAEARAELGTYQDGVGDLPPWAELAQSTKDDRVRQGYSENDPGLRSGAMRDSIERAIEGRTGHVGSNDEHLVFFELGTAKQPPRPVLAGALLRKQDEIAYAIGRRVVGRLIGEGVHPSVAGLGHTED